MPISINTLFINLIVDRGLLPAADAIIGSISDNVALVEGSSLSSSLVENWYPFRGWI